jgi:tryptophanyl-tRNA synthetase
MRVVTGIRPTGKLHIGNYLNTVKQYKELQDENECVFFIADLHGLTTPYNQKEYKKEVREKAIDIIASGLDPEKCVIYIQSHVQEVSELTWLLSTVTPAGDLKRMTQFKEKSKKQPRDVNAGLLNYPILMAADILIQRADKVPVGKDQEQHLELTRTIARKFNNKFKETFKEPDGLILKSSAKIMSLQDPKKKMSKSDPDQTSIGIFDKPETLRKKIMSAVTDTGKEIKYNPKKKPGISNLLNIYSILDDKEIKETEKEFKKKSYKEFKESLAELLIDKFEPFRRKKEEILSRDSYIEEILEKGAKRARTIAQSTTEEVKKKMGLL